MRLTLQSFYPVGLVKILTAFILCTNAFPANINLVVLPFKNTDIAIASAVSDSLCTKFRNFYIDKEIVCGGIDTSFINISLHGDLYFKDYFSRCEFSHADFVILIRFQIEFSTLIEKLTIFDITAHHELIDTAITNQPVDSIVVLVSHAFQSYGSSLRSKNLNLPAAFQWPPPNASSTCVFNLESLRRKKGKRISYFDVGQWLDASLNNSGYFEKVYYPIPGGFAIITRLERIDKKGMPDTTSDRWNENILPIKSFNLTQYFKALFTASPGYYRVIVFTVSPIPFRQRQKEISGEMINAWIKNGYNTLPKKIANQKADNRCVITTLIYEFEKSENDSIIHFLSNGRFPAKVHLETTGLWNKLAKAR
jgi:hypothetical protein